jgi:secreted Zn-dependent insulinase-like peptidase
MMSPDACFILHTSNRNQQLPNLQREHYYGTQYSIEQIDATTKASWCNSQLEAALLVGYPEPNVYVPKQPLQSLKLISQENVKPRLINEQGGSKVWFKQDNQYD